MKQMEYKFTRWRTGKDELYLGGQTVSFSDKGTNTVAIPMLDGTNR